MTVDTNYGIDLQQETAPASGEYYTIGEIVNLDVPALITGEVEKTHHASGGYRQFIPDGLINLDEFTVTLNCTQAVIDNKYQDMRSKIIRQYRIVFPPALSIQSWTFGAFPTKIDIQEADAKTPDVTQVELTLRPSGEPDGIYL